MDVRCSVVGPVGELHPVRGLLETFEVGPGCAAREHGNKETHVIAVGRVTNSPENKVTSSKGRNRVWIKVKLVKLVFVGNDPGMRWFASGGKAKFAASTNSNSVCG